MPRGKYVNHKGRSRNFTSPEELEHQNEESDDSDTSSEEDEGAAASAKVSGKSNTKARAKRDNSTENDSEESSEEDDRDARKGVASLIEIENPNRSVKKSAQKLKTLSLEEEPVKPELTRREREQIEKQKARLRYEKLHAAGKTNEAKADLARLALVRQQRAEAAAKREAEKKASEEKKAAASKS